MMIYSSLKEDPTLEDELFKNNGQLLRHLIVTQQEPTCLMQVKGNDYSTATKKSYWKEYMYILNSSEFSEKALFQFATQKRFSDIMRDLLVYGEEEKWEQLCDVVSNRCGERVMDMMSRRAHRNARLLKAQGERPIGACFMCNDQKPEKQELSSGHCPRMLLILEKMRKGREGK